MIKTENMRISFSKQFAKQRDKAPCSIQKTISRKLELFIKDPHNKQFNNHVLKGKLKFYRSIDITGDWRALYRQEGDLIFFTALGTHSRLYK